MNKKEFDILRLQLTSPCKTQRDISSCTGYSLGTVNPIINKLIKEDYLDKELLPLHKTKAYFEKKKTQKAIILAAGFGMRMVPINIEIPKGLIEVYGEPLIERIIKQLHDIKIFDIYIVVGFLKEKYEYLIDLYGVKLIVNAEYSVKNNLYSLRLASKYISNTYIVPCDIWSKENPFSLFEDYSWYAVNTANDIRSGIRINRKMQLVPSKDIDKFVKLIGISYINSEDAVSLIRTINTLSKQNQYNNDFWETALFSSDIEIYAKITNPDDVIEINTYEQLRDIDNNSGTLRNEAISIICEVLHSSPNEISNIKVLKKGMTNRSFLFSCKDKKYIMRIPGKGTDFLINRHNEADVYKVLNKKNISDEVLYISPENGFKISLFWNDTHVCNPNDKAEVQECMNLLRDFHFRGLKVDHEFDLFLQIDKYERLRGNTPSVYRDYIATKENILSLRSFIESNTERKVLTHIDSVPDNFLFFEKDGKTEIHLIDWEYAGMQDPHVDIAMFAIYSFYDRHQIDELIDMYFIEGCSKENRIKIYCYVAVCGLLWSNWCEYKLSLGIEFGEYSLRQYRYAKEFFHIAHCEIEKLEQHNE